MCQRFIKKLKAKEEGVGLGGGAFRLYCRLDSCDRRARRKGNGVGRASDSSAILEKVGPGQWDVLEPAMLVQGFLCCIRVS